MPSQATTPNTHSPSGHVYVNRDKWQVYFLPESKRIIGLHISPKCIKVF
jgi:hypothetical protein